ncbi:MAG TPA: 2'-5' RNA ligase family protein [Anaerolineaceae bacterium]|jgi:2'-5' RNA ligase
MSFAVTLQIDADAEAAVLSIREKLLRRGIHPIPDEMRARPHLTLGMWNGQTPAGFLARLAGFAAVLPAQELTFSSIGLFPNREGILFLAPVVTSALLDLHTHFHHEVVPPGLEPDRACLPGAWTPHLTLAIALADWEMHAAVDIAREPPMPLAARISEIALFEFPPAQEIAAYPLVN